MAINNKTDFYLNFRKNHQQDIVDKYTNQEGYNCTVLGIEYGVSRTMISNILKECNITVTNPGDFKKDCGRPVICDLSEDNPYNAYWLGFLYGDGSLDSKGKLQLGLSPKDKDHVIKFSNFILGGDFSKTYKNVCTVQVSNQGLTNNLIKNHIVPNKTYIPLKEIKTNYKSDWIRGYFDADGWIYIGRQLNKQRKIHRYYNRYCFGLCAYSEENLQIVQSYLPHKGIITKKNSQTLFELRFGSFGQIIDLANFLDGPEEIRLDRKWKKLDLLRQSNK